MTKERKTVNEELLLGIDVGKSNIGIAIGRSGYVQPIRILPAKDVSNVLIEISKIAFENKITKFVLGLPLDSNNKETPQSLEVKKFAKLLKIHTRLPVAYVNEYLSSKEALGISIKENTSQKKRKTLDDIAAALILKRYFEEN